MGSASSSGTGGGPSTRQPIPMPGAMMPVPGAVVPVPLTPEPGANDPNPYSPQTAANTSNGWLDHQHNVVNRDGTPTVGVDLHGMADYATDMKTVSDNLMSLALRPTMQAQPLIGNAWPGEALPEGGYMNLHQAHNFQELGTYLNKLATAVNNIANAAQAVADYYGNTDGWSAADIDAVKFAYGDKSIPPPTDWPYPTDKGDLTWSDQEKANAQKQAAQKPQDVWGQPIITVNGNTTVTVQWNQNSVNRTTTVTKTPTGQITIESGPDGNSRTTVSKQPDGSTLKTVVDSTGTTETRTTSSSDWTHLSTVVDMTTTVETKNGKKIQTTVDINPPSDWTHLSTVVGSTTTVATKNGNGIQTPLDINPPSVNNSSRTQTTTVYDQNDQKISETTHVITTNKAGQVTSTDTVTTSYDKQGHGTLTNHLSLGAQTVSPVGRPDPAVDATIDIDKRNPPVVPPTSINILPE